MRFGMLRGTLLCVTLALLFAVTMTARGFAQAAAPSHDSAFSIPKADLIQPAELNSALTAQGTKKPLVLQVGSHMLFTEAHIAGSEYAGAGSQEAGRKMLQERVSALPRSSSIVIYCGCCPWERCPNLGPAFKALRDMGFTNVKALYIAQNFGADWVDKGYAVDRAH